MGGGLTSDPTTIGANFGAIHAPINPDALFFSSYDASIKALFETLKLFEMG